MHPAYARLATVIVIVIVQVVSSSRGGADQPEGGEALGKERKYVAALPMGGISDGQEGFHEA